MKVSAQTNIDSVIHPVASARDFRNIQRLGVMDEAQMVLPGGIETTEVNAREWWYTPCVIRVSVPSNEPAFRMTDFSQIKSANQRVLNAITLTLFSGASCGIVIRRSLSVCLKVND
jgi:hypothetical protein